MWAYTIDTDNKTANLVEVNTPKITTGEILLKVEKWSLCRTDISHMQSRLGIKAGGAIAGHEVLGVVAESKDQRIQVGEYISYMGATDFGGGAEFKKLKCVTEQDERKKSSKGSPTEWFFTERNFFDVYGAAIVKINKENKPLLRYGSLLEPLCCILRVTENHKPNKGSNVIILGAGCIGALAIQCFKEIYHVNKILILDIDPLKLDKVSETYQKYGNDIIPCLVKTKKEGNSQIDTLINETKGAFGEYLFDALPPYIDISEFPDTRYLGANLLSPQGKYMLFSATTMAETTMLFWSILSKGITLTATGFDQRAFSMVDTALVLKKARDFVNNKKIDLQKVVTKEINFFDEQNVKKNILEYGRKEFLWKTIISL